MFPVSSLRDVHGVHSDCNTGKYVHVKFNKEFEGYVQIADTEQQNIQDMITVLGIYDFFVEMKKINACDVSDDVGYYDCAILGHAAM